MTIIIAVRSAGWIRDHQAGLVDLLRDAVANGAGVSFLAPLDEQAAHDFWHKIAADVDAGRVILVAANHDSAVAGCVLVVLAWQPNSPHRAEIQKLIVHTDFRRQGIATRLMQTAESAALAAGRWLLHLDTEVDGGAEALYDKLNYERVGVIPQFAVSNATGQPMGTVIYYKLLSSS